ncbi:pyridoxamine 5'-phosphate oxidase family protein [Streptomyces sp. JJ36]|uniref:pyridoxamine 5'-phosphate oxidase family protein n=1 Tax=Streptomyces sp. JJ36 TaxID=2736645 RepID=UPI001F032181|nr:TIGR03618 family F420-dependent PPOX class oxidoreductase [Streptomyces sp. JJ36]MCF6523349.1 TIGR03618 family F420-dependent PPOX class oxidoreductase [Streptomyces sp. JJ36]
MTKNDEEGPPRPGPRTLSEQELSGLLGGSGFGVLATNKRSGHPHLTTMLYHWDPQARLLRFATTADRVKVRHLRRDPRAALHVATPDHMAFVVAEGRAELTAVTGTPGDDIGRELLSLLPAPPPPGEEQSVLAGLVDERRLVVRLLVDRLYGTALDGAG